MILEKPPPPILPKSPPPYVFYEIDELEIARQLTIKSFDIYKKIKVNYYNYSFYYYYYYHYSYYYLYYLILIIFY